MSFLRNFGWQAEVGCPGVIRYHVRLGVETKVCVCVLEVNEVFPQVDSCTLDHELLCL